MAKTDNKYTTVQMEERKPKAGEVHDLEEPFDEDFWLKVGSFVVIWMQISHATRDSQNMTLCKLSSIFSIA